MLSWWSNEPCDQVAFSGAMNDWSAISEYFSNLRCDSTPIFNPESTFAGAQVPSKLKRHDVHLIFDTSYQITPSEPWMMLYIYNQCGAVVVMRAVWVFCYAGEDNGYLEVDRLPDTCHVGVHAVKLWWCNCHKCSTRPESALWIIWQKSSLCCLNWCVKIAIPMVRSQNLRVWCQSLLSIRRSCIVLHDAGCAPDKVADLYCEPLDKIVSTVGVLSVPNMVANKLSSMFSSPCIMGLSWVAGFL